jgi:MFS family permease
MVEGVLPLHFADRLSQAQLGAAYAATSLIVAASSALAATIPPHRVLPGALVAGTIGLTVAGAGTSVLAWAVALALIGVGVGAANTGSIGVLLATVPAERIVLAMVVWSQLGIIGYLAGPIAGGAVAELVGYGAIGVVPLTAAIAVLLVMRRAEQVEAPDAA